MRLSVFLLLGSVAIAPALRPPTSRPIIILVHGRGQLGHDTAALRREWKSDLDASLSTVGLEKLADADVRLAWYADILDPESDSGCANARDTQSLGFGTFARDMLASMTSTIPEQDSRDARSIVGDLLFVVDPWTRCAAERRVGRVIEAAVAEHRPVVVVAYSLGSLVTYSYLKSLPPTVRHAADLRLITIGSPLGIREFRDIVFDNSSDIILPGTVSSWVNVYDPDDLFAAPLADRSTSRVQDRVATRSNSDAHSIGRYLRDRVTGVAVAQALCAAAKDQFGEACSRL